MTDRSTTDLLILIVASTICGSILITVIALGTVEIVNPNTDTTDTAMALAAVMNTLVGLLAGYLAGRTQRQRAIERKTDDNGD